MKTLSQWLETLEDLFVDDIGEETQAAAVALSAHPEGGIVANIVIGTAYDLGDELKQINVSLVPFDIGIDGDEVRIETGDEDDDWMDDFDRETEDGEIIYFNTRVEARLFATGNRSECIFRDQGQDAPTGRRWSCERR